jgi:hypothetical protein
MQTLTDHQGRAIRLTEERQAHILEHPEMQGQEKRIREALAQPEFVVATPTDITVHVYGRFYETTPVTSKYLQVVVKLLLDDAFVLTAYYSSRPKRGRTVWPE